MNRSKLTFFLIVGFAIAVVGMGATLTPLLYYRFGPPDVAATEAALAVRATEVALSATEVVVAATLAAIETPPGEGLSPQPSEAELTWDGLKIDIIAVEPEAWPLVRAQNQNNEPPLAGKTMLLITLEVSNMAGSGDEPLAISESDFKLIGSRRVLYTSYGEESNCGVVPDALDGVVALGGYPMRGNVCFQVPLDENDFQLVYERYVGDYPAVYIDLPEPEQLSRQK